MRSINVKRVAAVAAGATMIGSVMASGLAAVTQQGEVSTFVDTIKDNLGSTKVVLGSAADISDGVNAAKLAAVLASLNYESAGTVSGDATVTVETTSAGVSISTNQYDVEYTGGTTTSHYDSGALTTGKTITPTTLSDILTESDISVTFDSSAQTYAYREEILIGPGGATDVKYGESGTTVTPGHGLYWNAPFGQIVYRLNFKASGNGLPVNKSKYSDVPTVRMLGTDYSIDLTDLNNQIFSLYSGEQLPMSVGDTYDVTGADGLTYTVTLDSVDPVTTTTGTKYKARFSATDGTTTQTFALEEQVGYEFFTATGKITVYPITVLGGTTGSVIVRVGSGKQRFNVGSGFPLDDRWTVNSTQFSSSTTATGYLEYVSVKYGDTGSGTDYVRLGAFTGTYLSGLKEGIVIPGPENQDGIPLFEIQLVGFGSTSPVQSTEVELQGWGGGTNTTDIIQAKWYSQDGVLQSFLPSQSGNANWSYYDEGAHLDPWLSTTAPWTVINDKVVVFKEVSATSASTPARYATFEIDGRLVETTQTTNTTVDNVTLTYTTPNNPITCTVEIRHTTRPNQVKLEYAATACDTNPDNVLFGDVTQMDQTDKPHMNLTYIMGGAINKSAGTSIMRLPFIKFDEPVAAADNFTVIFDSSNTLDYKGAADSATGLVVVNTTTKCVNGRATCLGTNYSDLVINPGDVIMVQGSVSQETSMTDANLHHITAIGTVLNGATAYGPNGILYITMPEKVQNAIVRVAASQEASNATAGTVTSTLSAGQSTSGVKIVSINAGVAAGTYYSTRASTANPETIVVLDGAAPASGYRIVIGGPWVNTIAAGMADSSLVTEVGAQYLIAEDDDLLAAGYSATDTSTAVSELIDLLTA